MPSSPVALITGASSGFGRLISRALARDGYHVIGAFRGSRGGFDAQAAAFASDLTGAVGVLDAVRMDVTDGDSVNAAVSGALERVGRIDVLINSAGYGLLGPMECTDIAQTQRLYDTNVFGTMRVCRAVLPQMRAQGHGRILNFSSDVGLRANFFQSSYAASKFAVDGLSQVMRLELASFGIDVCLISPGWYGTAFSESLVTTFDSTDAAAEYAEVIADWNRGVNAVEGANDHPEEVAELVRKVLADPHPRFRNAVGWNADRMGAVAEEEIDRYQEGLLRYYQLTRP